MILVNLANPRPQPHRGARIVRAWRRLVERATSAADRPKPAQRVDRRRMRLVFCGEHGAGENWIEKCPQCNGYVDRVRNATKTARLDRAAADGEENLIRAAAVRAVAHIEMN